MNLIEKVFGTHSERELKMIYPIVDKIEALRPTMQAKTDEERGTIPVSLRSAWQTAKLWMTFFRRHLLQSVRLQSVC